MRGSRGSVVEVVALDGTTSVEVDEVDDSVVEESGV
jgi:hypothetical protein